MEIDRREGSIVSAKFPAPVSQGPLGAMWLVEMTATEALSQDDGRPAPPSREAQGLAERRPGPLRVHGHNQYGEHAHGVFLDQIYVGGGAYRHRDGLTAAGPPA